MNRPNMHRLHAAVVVGALSLSPAIGQDPAAEASGPTLREGSPAPPLVVTEWLKGDPVERFEAGKVYVVEFWSPRSSRCLGRIPHLTALQRRHAKDGLSIVWVCSADSQTSSATARSTVAGLGEAIGFSVAWDEGAAARDYMAAAERTSVPRSFLIDREGEVAYIGRRWLELALAGVLADDWDPEAGEREIEAAKEARQALRAAVRDDPSKTDELVDAFVEEYPLSLLTDSLADLRLQGHAAAGDLDRALAVASGIVDAASATNDAVRLNTIAWWIVDPASDPGRRDLALAERAAAKAVALTGEKDGLILDTLARVHFWKKDLKRAIELQEKALQVETVPARLKLLRAALEEYRKAIEADETIEEPLR